MHGFAITACMETGKICQDVWPYLVVLSSILIGCAFIFMNLQRHIAATESTTAIVSK